MAWIEINKPNFYHNLDYFSLLVGGADKLAVGLKDNAYGHGIHEIAKLSFEYGIRHVFVKNDFEATLIKDINFESVLVLYGTNHISYIGSINIAIVSIEQLRGISCFSNIELKIDTGMHRNGLLPNELDEAIKLIKDKELQLVGVFTHFSSADENSSDMLLQEDCFQRCVKKLSNSFDFDFRVHCGNSCATHKVDVDIYDLFRIGIGIYGYIDLEPFQSKLKPVMSLMAKKISTREIKKNETVGYGSSAFVSKCDQFLVSCYDVGYGDGFFRLDENKKYYLDDGRPILGRVSMDSLSVEGSDDSIQLFHDVTRLAKVHKTITYEIMVSLNPLLSRYIVE